MGMGEGKEEGKGSIERGRRKVNGGDDEYWVRRKEKGRREWIAGMRKERGGLDGGE